MKEFITDDERMRAATRKLAEQSAKLLQENDVDARIERNFTYHPPREGQPERYARIREQAKQLALLLAAECPDSRERSLALTKLEEAVFWANAAIARNETA